MCAYDDIISSRCMWHVSTRFW